MILALLWLATAAYLVIVLRQVRSVTAQLERQAAEDAPSAVTLALVVPQLEQLTARVNEAVEHAREASARTRREERQIRSFIADVSHDLRTPLTPVRGYLQLLERSDLTATQREQLAAAQRQAVALGPLVDRLYEYAYLLDVEPHRESEPVDVGVLVGEVLLDMAEEIEAAGLEVAVDPPTGLVLRSDREVLTRIVQNLARNAVQLGRGALEAEVAASPRAAATTNGVGAAGTAGGAGSVSAADGAGGAGAPAAPPSADGIALRVCNGVAPGATIDTSRLFDRFYTADASRSSRTSGLGLSIVKVLVTGLGGTVEAHHDAERATLEILARIPDGG